MPFMVSENAEQKKKYMPWQKFIRLEMMPMDDLLESGEFHAGLAMGVCICQQMILNAHERNEPLTVDGKSYYIIGGQELLRQMVDSICDG